MFVACVVVSCAHRAAPAPAESTPSSETVSPPVTLEEAGVEVMRMELIERDVTPPAAGGRCTLPPS